MGLLPPEKQITFESTKHLEKEKLKQDWIQKVHYDSGMDFIIFQDNYLVGEDNVPQLRNALHFNPQTQNLN